MYKVFKRFKLPIGHRLMKNTNRCFNYHGHNFWVEIQLSSPNLNKNDMVIDFSELKRIVNNIIDKFDHATILNPCDIININHLKNCGYRLELISPPDRSEDPTAEVFSKYLYKTFCNFFPQHNVDFVRVWENDDSMAEYSE